MNNNNIVCLISTGIFSSFLFTQMNLRTKSNKKNVLYYIQKITNLKNMF